MALADPTITQSESQVRLTVALLVVLMGSLYAHNRGDAFANDIPRKMSLRKLTERSLSTDVVELVGGRGQVSVTVTGEVGDIEGYPPVPLDIRTGIRNGEWTFPADIPLVELESRFADRLQNEFDLAAVEVRLDDRLASGETYRLVTLPADPHVDREFASLLRNADETMAVTTVAPDADLDGLTVSDVDTTVVAIRSSNRPVDAIPGRGRELAAGDTLYVVGRPEVLRKVERRATTDTGRTDGGDDDGADTGGSDGEASRSSGAQSS